MRQHPPAGPDDEPGNGHGPGDSAPTPDVPAAGTPDAAETQAFEQSPYDVPESPTEEVPAAYAAAPYGQAPDPARTIYSQTSTTTPLPEDEPPAGGRRWVVPVIIVVIVLVAAGIAAALLFGGDRDPVPTPTQTATTEAATTPEPTEEPTATAEPTTEAPTTEEPTTEEPTTVAPEDGELLGDLDDAVSVGEQTFTLDDNGWVPAQDVLDAGAREAYEGLFIGGDSEDEDRPEIEMLATLWADNEEADDFAQSLVDDLEGAEQVETGDTYTNGDGTYWAFVLEDERGRYIWTTDRGHVLQVTGSTDYVGPFYSNFPL